MTEGLWNALGLLAMGFYAVSSVGASARFRHWTTAFDLEVADRRQKTAIALSGVATSIYLFLMMYFQYVYGITAFFCLVCLIMSMHALRPITKMRISQQ